MRRLWSAVVLLIGMLSALLFAATPAAHADTPDHCGTSSPCARDAMGYAFDRNNDQIVLFGGTDNATPSHTLSDTWTYDVVNGGWTWHNITGPCGRHSARMAYDETNDVTVLFGGNGSAADCGSSSTRNDTWTSDGSSWTPVCTVSCTPPGARASFAFAWDGAEQDVVLFGGTGSGCSPSPCGDTWSWDGSTWAQRCNNCADSGDISTWTEPQPRKNSSMIYSGALGQLILTGGDTGSGLVDNTFRWDGSADSGNGQWHAVASINSPAAHSLHRLAYDENTGLIMMFGGCTATCDQTDLPNATLVNDQFSRGTGSWSALNPSPRPSARCCMMLVYADDSPYTTTSHSPGIYLFGGGDTTHTGLGDMYFYHGTAWCKVTGTTTCGTSF